MGEKISISILSVKEQKEKQLCHLDLLQCPVLQALLHLNKKIFEEGKHLIFNL